MKDLLFLSQRIPYPPNKGDKIRSFHILQHLCQHNRVYLACFIDDPYDLRYRADLEKICADCCFVEIGSTRAKIRSARGLLTGQALNLPFYYDRRFADWTRRVLTDCRPEAAFVFSSAVAQYVIDPALRPPRLVMDFIDVDSDKWRQYAKSRRWPMSWIYAREAEKLLEFDRQVASAADACSFVSDAEVDLFASLAPESAGKLHAIANGIDTAFFDPALVHPKPFDRPGAALVFTGAMDYWPNVDAVVWFATEILPRLRADRDETTFYIVGSKPTREVDRLTDLPGVVVTGRVADVRPYLAHADVVVAPMRIARGLQNKVLEGMAMARPVLTTAQGLEGIAAEAGAEIFVADDADGQVACIAAILDGHRDGAAVGRAARARIVSEFTWEAKLSAFDALLAG